MLNRSSFRGVLFPFFLLFLLFPASAKTTGKIKIIYPPERSIINSSPVEIIAYFPKENPPEIEILSDTGSFNVPVKNRLAKTEVELAKGVNMIRIGESTLQILYLPKRIAGELKIALPRKVGDGQVEEVYETIVTHGPFLSDCAFCHPASAEGDYTTPGNMANLCYDCHDRYDTEYVDEEGNQVGFVHGPVAFGGCRDCHDPHVAKGSYILKERGNDLCLMCHEDKTRNLENNVWKYPHLPVQEGKCTLCHNPHASRYESQLVYAGNDLCLNCHDEVHAFHRTTAATTAVKTKIPIFFPKDADGSMKCYGCHMPHGSGFENLFPKEGIEFCQTCHQV